MTARWVTVAKLVGESSCKFQQLAQDFEASIQSQGSDLPRAESVANVLATNATSPPVMSYLRYLDPWSVTPLPDLRQKLEQLAVSSQFVELPCGEMLVCAVPKSPCVVRSVFTSLQTSFMGDQPEAADLRLAFRRCWVRWELLLIKHAIPSCVVLVTEIVGPSWLDQQVIDSKCHGMPIDELLQHYTERKLYSKK